MFDNVPMLTSGNLLAVPIIKLIGMTMALTVWGIFNTLSGWLQGLSVKLIYWIIFTCSSLGCYLINIQNAILSITAV